MPEEIPVSEVRRVVIEYEVKAPPWTPTDVPAPVQLQALDEEALAHRVASILHRMSLRRMPL